MASSINPHAVVQELQLEEDAEKFRMPFSMSISGIRHIQRSAFHWIFTIDCLDRVKFEEMHLDE